MFRQKGGKKRERKMALHSSFLEVQQGLWPHVLRLIIFLQTNINAKLGLSFRPGVHTAL